MEYEKSRFLQQLARYLGQIDLNPLSETYGCADRNFWHYQDQKGFSVGSMQVGAFATQVGHWLYKNPELGRASEAVQEYWQKEVSDKVLLDEYFCRQQSFCASSYSAMAMALKNELSRRLGSKPGNSLLSSLEITLTALKNSKGRPESANQSLAARLAHDIFYFQLKADKSVQNPFDAVFIKGTDLPSEYGGIDLGYSLKCIDICTLGILLIDNLEARNFYLDTLNKYLDFLQCVSEFGFHPSLGSRGNPHLLLGGLSLLHQIEPKLGAILKILRDRQLIPEMVSCETSDDKYLAFFHLTSLAIPFVGELFVELKERLTPLCSRAWVSSHKNLEKFSRAGIHFLNKGLVVSEYRGGAVLYIESEQRHLLNGFIYRADDGRIFCPSETRGEFSPIEEGFELIFRAQRFRQKTRLLQSFWGGTLVRSLLLFPMTRSLFRKFIYTRSKNTKNALNYFKFRWQNNKIIKTWLVPTKNQMAAEGWIFTDGHATRLRGDSLPQTSFDLENPK